MVKSYGVKCKACGEHIHLAEVNTDLGREITFYCLPLGPITCLKCNHVDDYESKESEFVGIKLAP